MAFSLTKWFKGPTEDDAYQRGRNVVDQALGGTMDVDIANGLFAESNGAFNETSWEAYFDKGVQDRLVELGFKDPLECP